MVRELTDYLRDALVGKKIKLTEYQNPNGRKYFSANIGDSPKDQKIGESFGRIKEIETMDIAYEGDNYYFLIVNESDEQLHVNGLYSITSKIEIID
jgi:hypothetical protein